MTGRAVQSAALAVAFVLAGLELTSARAQTPPGPAPAASADAAWLAGLPLVEIPAAAKDGDTFVVFYSGDAGWSATMRGVGPGQGRRACDRHRRPALLHAPPFAAGRSE
jgi:hypothetical protein